MRVGNKNPIKPMELVFYGLQAEVRADIYEDFGALICGDIRTSPEPLILRIRRTTGVTMAS
jgi:hypothetical protein